MNATHPFGLIQELYVTSLEAFVEIVGFGLVVTEGNGNIGTVEGIDSTQAVFPVTNPATDVVITAADEVPNGLVSPIPEVLHIGKDQAVGF